MGRLLDSILGSGWKGVTGGILMIVAGVGLGADVIGQAVGVDIIVNYNSTWAEVVAMVGAGLAAVGIRTKLERDI